MKSPKGTPAGACGLLSRTYSLSHSLWQLLQRIRNVYSPEAWLLRYYPQIYFAKLVTRQWELDNRPEKEIQSQHDETAGSLLLAIAPRFEVTGLSIVILGSICYTFLLNYHFFSNRHCLEKNSTDSQLEKSSSIEEPNPYGFANPVPARMLETCFETGLSEDEVIARQERYGRNEIWKRRNWFLVFRRLWVGPNNLIFQAAALSAIIARDWGDLLIICSLLAYNVWFSIESIRQYDDIAQSLALNTSIPVIALRDGRVVKMPISGIVPGDVVHVSKGSVMPADCRVDTYDGDLCIDQSSITGENTGIVKNYGDTCYAGTGVLRGDTFLTVVGTGYQTFLGRTLAFISDPSPERTSPLKIPYIPRQRREFHWVIHCIGTTFCVLIASSFAAIWRFSNRSGSSYITKELYLAIIVVAVPASLVSNIHSFHCIGAGRLSKDGAIVQSAASGVELLAGTDVLCVDKTGTLTDNRLTLLEPHCISCDPEDVILTASLTISPHTKSHDPIDNTFVRALKHYPWARDNFGHYKMIDFQPFNVETKMMVSLVEAPSGERILCAKGAPRAIFDICLQDDPNTENFSEEYKTMASDFARRGLRSLGVARKRETHKWELLGLVPLFDPPRFNTTRSIKLARTMGVSVRMFTGDAVAIAAETARLIGMSTKTLNSDRLGDDKMASDPETSSLIEEADVYAEVFPHHKEMIIRTLQDRGHLVAATGDGVNDSPTLRKADCGIAVEGSTEMAQSAADIVFLKAGIASIVQAMEKSRQMFQLTYTYLVYRTAVSLYLFMFVFYYFTTYHETLDLNSLILNIHISDIIGIAIQYDEQSTPYSKSPARWNTRKVFPSVVLLSTILMLGTWSAILSIPDRVAHSLGAPAEASALRAQTAFLQIVISCHGLVLLTRTNGRLWAYKQCWHVNMTVLFIDIGATLLCALGCVGNGHMMSMEAVLRVWRHCLGTMCVAAGSLCQLVDEPMLESQVTEKKGGNEASSSDN